MMFVVLSQPYQSTSDCAPRLFQRCSQHRGQLSVVQSALYSTSQRSSYSLCYRG